MQYCMVAKKKVYSCDHAKCNGQDPRTLGGMHYCRVYGNWVYGCDHAECNGG